MRRLRVLGLMLCVVLATGSAQAHFVWVAHGTGDDNSREVKVYFGEAAQPDAAKYLDMVTRLNVWHRGGADNYTSLDLHKVESNGKAWFRGNLPSAQGVIEATCLFGVFSHGEKSLLLKYYAKSLKSDAKNGLSRSRKLDLDVVPHLVDGAMMIGVFWKGQPLEGSQVVVSPPKGEPLELETDSRGVASLQSPPPGAYQVRARQIVKENGEFDGQKFDEAQHYSTLTFAVAEAGTGKLSGGESLTSTQDRQYPDLPRGITSFGAAVIGDWLYVYGGHFGRPHHYSNTSQSDELSRLSLTKASTWEVIATGPRLQGLAMVAHGGKLYRVGGFTAHNEEDDDHDLRSVADFVRFHPETGKWEPLPSLPEPRSSHDAVVIGDKLYVAGGWRLGGEDPEWHRTAWVTDLSRDKIVWESLSEPPFLRRAVSLGHRNGKLYVIGGMQQKGGPTTRVDAYDLASGQWSQAPSLIDPKAEADRGKGMEGFGSSAFTVDGRLLVSTYNGNIQVLEEGNDAWRISAKLVDDRFFHRMLPFNGRLLLVGGASMRAGKRLHFETVELSSLK